MRSFREIEKPEYGICLVSCECQVFNTSKSPKTFKLIERGSLAKFQYRKSKNGSVQTLVINESEVYMQNSLYYISIDHKLFKYLNAINDFEERVKFYENSEKRNFVLDLERNSVVSVGFSSGIQSKAVFQEIHENEDKIFITVELLELPFKYSLPANMVNTIAFFDSSQQDSRNIIKKFMFPLPKSKFDYSVLECWRCNDNVENGNTSNVNDVEPVEKETISQNPLSNYHEPCKNLMLGRSYNKAWNDETKQDFTGKTVGRNAKLDEKPCETGVVSALMIPSSSSTSMPVINSLFCIVCLKTVSEEDICRSCTNEMYRIYGPNKSQTNIVSNISLDSSFSSETPVTNEDDLHKNSKVAVRRNISVANCIICKNHLDISEGFFLILCKHTFCEMCIKNQITLKIIDQTNILPCCDRPIELDEVKYFGVKSLSLGEQSNMINISQNPGGSGLLEKYNGSHTNPTLESSDQVKCDEDLIDFLISPIEIPIKTSFCFICGNSNESDNSHCFNCGDELQKTTGKDNYQTDIDLSFILPLIMPTEIPENPFETKELLQINNCVISGDDLMHHHESTVRQNDFQTNCNICNCSLDISQGFLLRLCEHTVCETCVKNQVTLEKLGRINITLCCDRPIELNEIKYFLPAPEYEQFKTSIIEWNETNLYMQRCFGKNCNGFQLNEIHYDIKPTKYWCNKCELENCLKCEAIHVWLTCEQYRKLFDKENSLDDETKEMFLTWIREGTAMPCPKCVELIEKDEGCDWVQCSFCNTEICWATRGWRWGPGGKGDTSGGCGCDFKVKKCVDNCNYCC